MSSIKWELEDLSFFYYLEPDDYKQIARMVAESREAREYLAETIKTLTDELNRIGLEGFQINGRPKHYWSIYQKMTQKGKDFSEIYDLMAVRVIAFGARLLSARWARCTRCGTRCPGASKTISPCRSSIYQSLHTTVIGPRAPA